MAYDDRARKGAGWTRVVLLLVLLLAAGIVVSIVLRLVKLLVYAALLAVGVTVVARALRRPR